MNFKPSYIELEQRIKQLENKLQTMHMFDSVDEKELFKLAFENANIGMCLVDLKGNLFKVNSEMSNIFGFSVSELEKMNVNDITHPDFKVLSPRFIDNAARGIESNSEFEKKYIHKNGSIVTCAVISSSVLDKNKNLRFFISHVQDITAKKNIEKKIQEQNIELHKINAEKDKFFSIIAHDLINPFNAIIGFSELLVERVLEKDCDGVEEYSNIIQQSSEQAMNLLMNLLDWSRSQTGRMEFNPVHFQLSEIIDELELLFTNIARHKSITIRKKIPSLLQIFADRNMISTVLRNLVSNALKFTETGGEIIVSASGQKNELTISISDNGVGISPDRIEKIFQICESDSTSGTGAERGTGLGLVLCKEFIDKHHGKIWVESTIGQGSNFVFTIPK